MLHGVQNKSVNVSRLVLLDHLRANLEKYKAQYREAVSDYQTRLKLELADAVVSLQETLAAASVEGISDKDLSEIHLKFKVNFNFPDDHESDYVEVIEMMELSVDENINLDSQAFRAYIKNEWSWTSSFTTTFLSNKAYVTGKIGGSL